MRKFASLCLASFTVLASFAGEDLQQAVVENRSGLWQIATLSFGNPAVNQWRMTEGLTSVDGSYSHRSDLNNPDPRNGLSEYGWKLEATTYTKYRRSTLWGTAGYTNGKTSDVVWNETADSALLYPYLMADSVGGDMNNERYYFAGGYADNNGRLAWGVSMSYEAVLQYRSVDPRPRNVVGKLDAAAGVMVRLSGKHYVGAALNFQKYKQSNDIVFKSEMGVDKIFHLTGPATHYTRFAGTGLSTFYDGIRYGIDLNIYPYDGRGFFAACRLSRFSFDNILSDLNKLPLASAWHNHLQFQAGWKTSGEQMFGGVAANLGLFRRHGKETIFGDQASASFPVIGHNEMFADNGAEASLDARWGMKFGPVDRFHISFSPGWSHRSTAYAEPYSYRVLNRAVLSGGVAGTITVARLWMLDGAAGFKSDIPFRCSLNMHPRDGELRSLEVIERDAFSLESHRSASVSASIGVTRSIGPRYAVGLSGDWSHLTAYNNMKQNNYNLKISFIF